MRFILVLCFLTFPFLIHAQSFRLKQKIKQDIEQFLPMGWECLHTNKGLVVQYKDSCGYYQPISPIRSGYATHRSTLKLYIDLEKRWSQQKIDRVQAKNDSLANIKADSLRDRPYEDYRKWVPQHPYKGKAEYITFSAPNTLQRLPYTSERYKKLSIFLYDNRIGWFWTLDEGPVKWEYTNLKAIIIHRVLLLEDYGSLFVEDLFGF